MTNPDDDEEDEDIIFIGGRKGLIAFTVGITLAGPFVGVWALGDIYGIGMAALAGLIGGAGCALILVANRFLG